MSGLDKMFPAPQEPTEAEVLLREWASWWLETEDAPVKMPDALHVRTAIYFTTKSLNQSSKKEVRRRK